MPGNEWISEGFSFQNSIDAQQAAQESRKIEYLEAHMDYSDPENILAVYQKAITDRVFRTPVGIVYLKKLQDYLMNQEEIDKEKILPIPLYIAYENVLRDKPSPARQRIKQSASKKKKSMALPISVMLNIGLIVTVLAMFAMTLLSDQPNIVNYRNALVNQYASWEQELTEREQRVREKERELGIDSGKEKEDKEEKDGK